MTWSLKVRSAGDEPREYMFTEIEVGRLKMGVVGAAILGFMVVGALLVTVPRSVAYSDVVDENLALKARLQEIDRTMSEVDRILLRLRLYDAQLQSLGAPRGDHGPLPLQVISGNGMDEDGPWLDNPELGHGEAWAASVQGRAITFLDLFEKDEPDLSKFMEDLEDLKLLQTSLPSRWPTRGDFTSGYGWRKNPLGKRWRFHSGIDIAAKRGTPVFAAAPGTVVRAYYNEGYGRMVEIDHGFGITTVYAHCHILRVREGQRVEAGTLIGTMGSTGRVTGPHLHFEVRIEGHAVDPLDYLPR